MSRFESTLVEDFSRALTSPASAIAGLRLAAYRARKGSLSAARDLIQRIREDSSSTFDLQVYANINYVEAICEFFEGEIKSAIDRIRRSKILCQGLPANDDLPAIVAAWSANFFRIQQEWQRVEVELRELLSAANPVSSEADCRMSLVLGDCYQELEEYGRAAQYYSRAHAKALSYGDESMLGAVLYNRAAIRVFNLRLNEVSGKTFDVGVLGIVIEAASAENFSQYTDDHAMPGIYELLAGQLHLLRGDFAGALEKFGEVRVEALGKDWPAVELVRQADLLLASRSVGLISHETAKERAIDMMSIYPQNSCFGDVAVSAFTLSRIFESSDKVFSNNLKCIAQAALNRHKLDRELERQMLNRLDDMNAEL